MRILLLSCFLAACGAAPVKDPGAPETKGTELDANDGHGKATQLAPRFDLHCTPAAGEEAACAARGAEYHFGPPLVCRGAPPPSDLVEAERRAYEQATAPCMCISREDELRCSMMP